MFGKNFITLAFTVSPNRQMLVINNIVAKLVFVILFRSLGIRDILLKVF